MLKIILFALFSQFSLSFYCQSDTSFIKPRNLSFNDFMANYSINDTSAAVIELFFDKKGNNAYTEMAFLPITTALFLISPTIGLGLSVISVPFFIHGTFVLLKYNKKKLKRILVDYKTDNYLPKNIRKKANKIIYYYSLQDDY
ncbi:MAG: hypothetical protein CVT95_07465 [Bacteroidetes bacterium HGW-Bacteroidetes-12]|jgi:hypothetical protein|nr:MAG: hypothetical protein CVT95_07465 [Bacteroidetes bacterium HGW-Bacteroidetes-12]